MFYGKMKAVTFSYDDAVTQDRRLVALLDQYGLKATFNVNSGRLGLEGELMVRGEKVSHNKIPAGEVRELYQGHEVAVHTIDHPLLPSLDEAEIIRQVEEDRKTLERLSGREVVGMAYPCGGENNDDRVADIIRRHTGVRYARTITSSHRFDRQENLYRFQPSVYHMETEKLFALGNQFLSLKPDKPLLFYIWGHSYELDAGDGWDMLEAFCRLISGQEDIFYGTNREVLLDCGPA